MTDLRSPESILGAVGIVAAIGSIFTTFIQFQIRNSERRESRLEKSVFSALETMTKDFREVVDKLGTALERLRQNETTTQSLAASVDRLTSVVDKVHASETEAAERFGALETQLQTMVKHERFCALELRVGHLEDKVDSLSERERSELQNLRRNLRDERVGA